MNIINQILVWGSTVDLSSIKPERATDFDPIIGALITLAQMICYGAAVIILMITGIKFITAAPEGKAQIKEKMVPTFIGAIILFSVGTIVRIVANFAVATIS